MIIHTLKELGKIHPPNWLVNIEGNLDLQRNNEQLKAIRRAEWTEQQVIEYFFNNKEKQLEELYIKSTLPNTPDEQRIKALLLQCLEQHYWSLGLSS